MTDFDSPEFAERRKEAVKGILTDAIKAFDSGRYTEARDGAATAAGCINIEFVTERSRLKGLRLTEANACLCQDSGGVSWCPEHGDVCFRCAAKLDQGELHDALCTTEVRAEARAGGGP